MKTKDEKLAEAFIGRLVMLGVRMRHVPLVYIDRVCRGKAMMVVVRRIKCQTCGKRHRTACTLLPASKVHPRKLFSK